MQRQCWENMEINVQRRGKSVLGASIDALSWDDAIRQIVNWGAERASRYVCICNVHSVVTTTRDPEFQSVINAADMSTPDGAPIAWALRKMGYPDQERINGPDLMWKYLGEAERLGHLVFFYGSTETTLAKLRENLNRYFPALRIAGMHSPHFCEVDPEQDQAEIDMINHSAANVAFIGLGCPKQEKWMAAHRGRVNATMVGVGAAFDYHAGVIRRAPLWWQNNGLEWLYRIISEPRRLFKRYLVTNTLFVIGFAKQLIAVKIAGKNDSSSSGRGKAA